MATATRMTREQMIDRLNSLKVGTKIIRNEKVYTVMGIKDMGGKLNRRDMCLLEDGVEEEYWVEGKYLATGKMLKCSNLQFRTMLAQKMYMDFEIVG